MNNSTNENEVDIKNEPWEPDVVDVIIKNDSTNENEVYIKHEPLEPDVVDVSLCFLVSVSVV